MANHVQLKPELVRWARERAGLSVAALEAKFPTYSDWENGRKFPTLKQLESLARKTRTPLGYFFLNEPPEDKLPIPDFRTVADAQIRRPSPDLLETVETMQRRQDWLREFLVEEGAEPLSFVGATHLAEDPAHIAQLIRSALEVPEGWANEETSWTIALQYLRERIDAAGVFVVINGVAGNSTQRKLKEHEFRGFALADDYAPLIFINGTDAKAAQMFTLIHELAHIWLGVDGVSNFEALHPTANATEEFCNQVAAEFLVPSDKLRATWPSAQSQEEPFQYLARRFKVSPLVTARRTLDLGMISKVEFFSFWENYEQDDRRQRANRSGGGNFWNTQNTRVGLRFGTTVVRAAKEGKLLYRDAYKLTGLHGQTFDRFAERLGYHV